MFNFKDPEIEAQKELQKIENGKDPNRIDLFHKMTESQLDTFSGKLVNLPEIQGMAQVGETMHDFKQRIKQMLVDETKQSLLSEALEKVGFKKDYKK